MMGGYGRGYGSGFNNVGGGSWFGGGMMLLFGVLVLVGIVLLVIWAVRASHGQHAADGGMAPSAGASGHDEAVVIAKRRLASGEIDKAQYEELMHTLGR